MRYADPYDKKAENEDQRILKGIFDHGSHTI
jgi:hypothetical protein